MNSKSTAPIPGPIEQLQRQLDEFRSSRPHRTKLPETLWQAAVELAQQHGVYSVAVVASFLYAIEALSKCCVAAMKVIRRYKTTQRTRESVFTKRTSNPGARTASTPALRSLGDSGNSDCDSRNHKVGEW